MIPADITNHLTRAKRFLISHLSQLPSTAIIVDKGPHIAIILTHFVPKIARRAGPLVRLDTRTEWPASRRPVVHACSAISADNVECMFPSRACRTDDRARSIRTFVPLLLSPPCQEDNRLTRRRYNSRHTLPCRTTPASRYTPVRSLNQRHRNHNPNRERQSCKQSEYSRC